MRLFLFSLSALSLGTLVVLGPAIASAQDSPAPIHKRASAGLGHKRVVNSRRADLNKRDALSALQLINATIIDKTASSLPAANAGADPAGAKNTPPVPTNSTSNSTTPPAPALKFPDIGFKMPSKVPSSIDGWWSDQNEEYAFMGFSYEVTACELLRRVLHRLPTNMFL